MGIESGPGMEIIIGFAVEFVFLALEVCLFRWDWNPGRRPDARGGGR